MTEQAQEQAAPEPQEQAQEQERTFTQADLNKIAANEKREGRSSVLSELGFEDFDDLKSTVEKHRAVEQETQTEAEKYQKQLKKLTPKAEKAERYEKALTTFLERERDGVPEHIGILLDNMDPVDQLNYLSENKPNLVPQETGRTTRRSPDLTGGAGGSGSGSAGGPVSEDAFNSHLRRMALGG